MIYVVREPDDVFWRNARGIRESLPPIPFALSIVSNVPFYALFASKTAAVKFKKNWVWEDAERMAPEMFHRMFKKKLKPGEGPVAFEPVRRKL